MGTPLSGKSTLLKRLIRGKEYVIIPEKPGETFSTPMACQPVLVTMRKLTPKVVLLYRSQENSPPENVWNDDSGLGQLLVSFFLKYLPTSSTEPRPENMEQLAQGQTQSTQHMVVVESVPAQQVQQPTLPSTQPMVDEINSPAPKEQQPTRSPGELVPCDTQQEILSTALQNINLEEAEKDLEGSVILHILDTGGQREYMEVLPGLLTGPAVNLLVFRLIDELQERFQVQYVPAVGKSRAPYESSYTVEETLLQAFTCVSHRDPPELSQDVANLLPSRSTKSVTLIVGTYADKQKQVDEIDKQLQCKFKEIEPVNSEMVWATGKRLLYTVDNTDPNDANFDSLHDDLTRTIRESFESQLVPSTWLMFYLAVQSTEKKVLSFMQCSEIAQKHGISTDSELKCALWYLSHQFGVLRYVCMVYLKT